MLFLMTCLFQENGKPLKNSKTCAVSRMENATKICPSFWIDFVTLWATFKAWFLYFNEYKSKLGFKDN